MIKRRTIIAALALAVSAFSAPQIASAQGYGGHGMGYGNGAGHPCSMRMPLFRTQSWNESEDGGWNGVWTFNGGDRTSMSAVWTNNQTGRHRRAGNMLVTCRGQQVIINRPRLGNYVGTISPDGRSASGTLSWSPGNFSVSAR
jgi:hypothetical protein